MKGNNLHPCTSCNFVVQYYTYYKEYSYEGVSKANHAHQYSP